MYKTIIRFNNAQDDKILKTQEEPEITCEIGFMRFVFFKPDEQSILVNSIHILSVSVEKLEEIQKPVEAASTFQQNDPISSTMKDLFPDAD